jgi:signal transduction histidine kinase
LSIVKHLVQAMHGSVWADSQPGQGATFFVRLPAAKQAAETGTGEDKGKPKKLISP